MKTALLILSLIPTLALLQGCDPEHKKKCEWYLVPDMDRPLKKFKDGFIPVCARNYKRNKQDCRLQATLAFAKEKYQKRFRYTEMEVDGVGIPREVLSIKYCSQ